ncbi:MAG: putative thioredoxin [Polaromonas sp.]|jgi:thioredoxin 1|nr:putative thioredoxin [Polaromonas sp.]
MAASQGFTDQFAQPEPTPPEIAALVGPVLLEFGTEWCGYCRAAQPLIASAFQQCADVQHIKIEDGSGRGLGRAFKVKLWPTLVFLRDGMELTRLVRPQDADAIAQHMAAISRQV